MNTSLPGILVVGSAVALLVALACASDTDPIAATVPPILSADADAGPVGVNSGLDPEKPLNQLTDAETSRLCQAIAPPALEVASDPDKSHGSCVLTIIQTQFTHTLTTLEQCIQAMAECDSASVPAGQASAAAPVPSVLAAGMSCVGSTPTIQGTCRANVGELEGCITTGISALAVANAATCDTIVSGAAARQVAQTLGNLGVLACQGYKSKCPDGFAAGP